jgi:hypothetical protein
MAKFSFKNKNLYQETLMYLAIGNKGVQLALKESQRKGIPTVFGIMDKVFYRMPDGTITTKSPFKKRKK